MLTIFAVGTVWFWLLVAAESIALLALVSAERVGWATISVVATLLLVRFLGGSALFAHIAHDPWYVVLGIVGYAAAGALWGIGKWWFFVRRARERYDELKGEFLAAHDLDGSPHALAKWPVPAHLRKEWKDHVTLVWGRQNYGNYFGGPKGPVPKLADHKGRILAWMMYWPWSLIGTLIDDPIRKMFKAILRAARGLLESISARIFAGVHEDFQEPPPSPPKKNGSDGGPTADGGGPATTDGLLQAATVDDALDTAPDGRFTPAPKDPPTGDGPHAQPPVDAPASDLSEKVREPGSGRLESVSCTGNPTEDEDHAWDLGGERFGSR